MHPTLHAVLFHTAALTLCSLVSSAAVYLFLAFRDGYWQDGFFRFLLGLLMVLTLLGAFVSAFLAAVWLAVNA